MQKPRLRENDPHSLSASGPGRGLGEGRPAPPRWGSLPAGRGVVILLGAVAVGAIASVLADSGPGLVLGLFLLAGSAAAAFAVHPRRAYLLFPLPALAYIVAAITTGLINYRALGTSHAALAVSAAQWIASGFLPMTAATAAVIAIVIARWLSRRHDP